MLKAKNISDLLRAAADSAPDAPAFEYRDERISYRDWDALSDQLAARFAAGGVGPGSVVALLLPSIPLYLVAYLAAARLGAITTGINTRYRRSEIGHILRQSGAVTLLGVAEGHGANFRDLVAQMRADLPELRDEIWLAPDELRLTSRELADRLVAGLPRAKPIEIAPGDAAAIIFTSGTTGVPKGACYTHSALLALAEIETRRYADGVIPFKKHLAAGLSFAHIGTMARIGIQISHAGLSILHDSFDPGLVLETIERERLLHLGGIPTQIVMLLDHPDRPRRDLSSLRSILIGGAPSSPALLRRIADTFRATISVRYSSTEVGIATASLPDDSPDLLTTTVGKPTPGVELRIVDSHNQPLPCGEIGEVVVRSPATMREYWRAPEKTAEVIDADRWIHTGDLGFLDDAGYLHLKGRQSEMYIRGGYNVFPEEVENVLAQHPAVARVGVIGVPDATFGEVGLAYVVPRDPTRPPRLGELRDFVSGELASFKRPDRLEIVAELPLTPMFKVDKRALRQRHQRDSAD